MNALRIFADVSTDSLLQRPGRSTFVRIVEPPAPQPSDEIDAAIEARIISILGAAQAFGETIEAAYRRKERELAAAFAALTVQEASKLQKRLSEDPRPDDALACRFARLVVDRRTRLLAVLADAPRRAATCGASSPAR